MGIRKGYIHDRSGSGTDFSISFRQQDDVRAGRQTTGIRERIERAGRRKGSPTERNARSGGIRALHFSAEKRKEGRGMHPSARAGVFATPAVKL